MCTFRFIKIVLFLFTRQHAIEMVKQFKSSSCPS